MSEQVIKPQLYDVSTGSPANLPEEQIPQALSSGKFAFQKGVEVPVLNPDGTPGTVPAEYAQRAFSSGFQYEPSSAQLDRIKTSETAGPMNATKAFAAGALRGPTLGLSDEAMTRSGLVNKSTLADLQKYRPGWSTAGEVTGIGADMFLNPVLGTGALVGRAGKVAKVGVEGLELGKLAKEGSAASKVLGGVGNIAAHGAGSAVEGALYGGIGTSISEHALGDPDLNAEKVLSNAGYGALFGGAIGTALKGAEIAVPEAVTAAKDGLVRLRNVIAGSGEGGSAGLLGKALPENISEAIGNRLTNLDKDQGIALVKDVTGELNGVAKNVQTSIKSLNSELRPIESESLINNADHFAVEEAKRSFMTEAEQALKDMKAKESRFSPKAMDSLEEHIKTLRDISPEASRLDVFNAMRDVKQGLGESTYGFSKIPTTQEVDSINVLNKLRSSINTSLKNPEIFGDVGARLAQHDDVLSQLYKYIPSNMKQTEFTKAFMKKTGSGIGQKWEFDPVKVERVFKRGETLTGQTQMALLDEFHKTISKIPDHIKATLSNVPSKTHDVEELSNVINKSHINSVEGKQKYQAANSNRKNSLGIADMAAATVSAYHPVLGAAMMAYKTVTKPIEQINKLAQIERMAGKVTMGIGRGAKAIFDPTIKALDKTRNIGAKIYTENKANHKELSEKLSELQNNPSKLMDIISQNTEHFQDAAPNTSQGLGMAAARGLQFLASKLPNTPNPNPFDSQYEPSDAEIAGFDRYRSIVENPLLALDQVKLGTIMPETVEALNTVFPKLYEEMKSTVMEHASHMLAKKQPIPYQTKQALSMFLGEPLDSSFLPASVQANQQAFIQGNQEHQNQNMAAKTRPSKAGMGKISLAERSGINHGKMES